MKNYEIIACCCRNSLYEGSDSDTVNVPDYVQLIELPCSGKIDMLFLLRAFESGVDGVMVVGCREEDCHRLEGSIRAGKRVGIDGLSVLTNPANDAIECLDFAALYALVGPESIGFADWSDANDLAAELDSAYDDLPDASLDITGPGEESGTYDTSGFQKFSTF